jgi:hypothetical protein
VKAWSIRLSWSVALVGATMPALGSAITARAQILEDGFRLGGHRGLDRHLSRALRPS